MWYFLSYDRKISRLLKFSCICPEVYGECLKISSFVQNLECIRKFPACVVKHWSYKKMLFVFYHMIQQISRLLKVSRFLKKIWHSSGNFLHVSRILFSILNVDEYYFVYQMPQKILNCLKFPAGVLKDNINFLLHDKKILDCSKISR